MHAPPGPPPADIPDGPLPATTRRFCFPEDPEDPPALSREDPHPPPHLVTRDRDPLPHEVYEARVPIVAALRMQGYTRDRIAHTMKLTRAAVDWCIREGRKRGELLRGMVEAHTAIEEEAVPLATEGLIHHLRKHDKDLIVKTLEGKGLLVRHTANDGGGGAPAAGMAFQFNFITKDGAALPAVPALPDLTGDVIGTARTE
jgi:predicted transcriptional regulator